MLNKWEMLGQLQEQSTRLRKVEKQLDKLQNERYRLVQWRIARVCASQKSAKPPVSRDQVFTVF